MTLTDGRVLVGVLMAVDRPVPQMVRFVFALLHVKLFDMKTLWFLKGVKCILERAC